MPYTKSYNEFPVNVSRFKATPKIRVYDNINNYFQESVANLNDIMSNDEQSRITAKRFFSYLNKFIEDEALLEDYPYLVVQRILDADQKFTRSYEGSTILQEGSTYATSFDAYDFEFAQLYDLFGSVWEEITESGALTQEDFKLSKDGPTISYSSNDTKLLNLITGKKQKLSESQVDELKNIIEVALANIFVFIKEEGIILFQGSIFGGPDKVGTSHLSEVANTYLDLENAKIRDIDGIPEELKPVLQSEWSDLGFYDTLYNNIPSERLLYGFYYRSELKHGKYYLTETNTKVKVTQTLLQEIDNVYPKKTLGVKLKPADDPDSVIIYAGKVVGLTEYYNYGRDKFKEYANERYQYRPRFKNYRHHASDYIKAFDTIDDSYHLTRRLTSRSLTDTILELQREVSANASALVWHTNIKAIGIDAGYAVFEPYTYTAAGVKQSKKAEYITKAKTEDIEETVSFKFFNNPTLYYGQQYERNRGDINIIKGGTLTNPDIVLSVNPDSRDPQLFGHALKNNFIVRRGFDHPTVTYVNPTTDENVGYFKVTDVEADNYINKNSNGIFKDTIVCFTDIPVAKNLVGSNWVEKKGQMFFYCYLDTTKPAGKYNSVAISGLTATQSATENCPYSNAMKEINFSSMFNISSHVSGNIENYVKNKVPYIASVNGIALPQSSGYNSLTNNRDLTITGANIKITTKDLKVPVNGYVAQGDDNAAAIDVKVRKIQDVVSGLSTYVPTKCTTTYNSTPRVPYRITAGFSKGSGGTATLSLQNSFYLFQPSVATNTANYPTNLLTVEDRRTGGEAESNSNFGLYVGYDWTYNTATYEINISSSKPNPDDLNTTVISTKKYTLPFAGIISKQNADSGRIDNLITWRGTVDSDLTAIKNKISSAFTYKGSYTQSEMNSLTGMKVGEVINLKLTGNTDGPNYVWNGTSWDRLGGLLNTDLSNYYNKSETEQYVISKINAVTGPGGTLSGYMPLSGGTFTGPVKFANASALGQTAQPTAVITMQAAHNQNLGYTTLDALKVGSATSADRATRLSADVKLYLNTASSADASTNFVTINGGRSDATLQTDAYRITATKVGAYTKAEVDSIVKNATDPLKAKIATLEAQMTEVLNRLKWNDSI